MEVRDAAQELNEVVARARLAEAPPAAVDHLQEVRAVDQLQRQDEAVVLKRHVQEPHHILVLQKVLGVQDLPLEPVKRPRVALRQVVALERDQGRGRGRGRGRGFYRRRWGDVVGLVDDGGPAAVEEAAHAVAPVGQERAGGEVVRVGGALGVRVVWLWRRGLLVLLLVVALRPLLLRGRGALAPKHRESRSEGRSFWPAGRPRKSGGLV
mmetsp:Transcript_10806/g.22458  ORF Transcript_10806/g.22458 Transcript_10806/m.22458 type:complete len:210 (-) Transcript_10806:128-757(-)